MFGSSIETLTERARRLAGSLRYHRPNQCRFDSHQVLILGLDLLARKNLVQIEEMNSHGWTFVVAVDEVSDQLNDILEDIQGGNNEIILLRGNILARCRQVFKLVQMRAHHVELYACRRSFLYGALARLKRQRIVVVERGDIGLHHTYRWFERYAMRWLYNFGDCIWFKEPYMETLLRQITKKPLYFIPNPAPTSSSQVEPPSWGERSIDFLWANRFLPERHGEWFTASASRLATRGFRSVAVGLRKYEASQKRYEKSQARAVRYGRGRVDFQGWVDPRTLMRQTKFFVMTGDRIFGNNALLEAMSFGAVPIVSTSDGIEILIQDGDNGFIGSSGFRGTYDSLKRALKIDRDTWTAMSKRSSETVTTSFSSQIFRNRLLTVYHFLGDHFEEEQAN